MNKAVNIMVQYLLEKNAYLIAHVDGIWACMYGIDSLGHEYRINLDENTTFGEINEFEDNIN